MWTHSRVRTSGVQPDDRGADTPSRREASLSSGHLIPSPMERFLDGGDTWRCRRGRLSRHTLPGFDLRSLDLHAPPTRHAKDESLRRSPVPVGPGDPPKEVWAVNLPAEEEGERTKGLKGHRGSTDPLQGRTHVTDTLHHPDRPRRGERARTGLPLSTGSLGILGVADGEAVPRQPPKKTSITRLMYLYFTPQRGKSQSLFVSCPLPVSAAPAPPRGPTTTSHPSVAVGLGRGRDCKVCAVASVCFRSSSREDGSSRRFRRRLQV